MSVARVESLDELISSAASNEQSDPQPINRDEEPNKTDPRKKRQLQGGFECVFVEEPPKQVQTECAICLCVLKDPHLVDCYCNSFCHSCIKPIQEDNKPCPLCNTNFTTCIPEKRLQRTLNEMKVYCSQKEFGCEWIGKLISLPQHLNIADDSEKPGHCLFTVIECTLCGENVQRKDIKEHKTHNCPQRPYICAYCNDYESTYEDVTSNHWPACPSCPVPCPNQCGVYPEQCDLDSHVDKECPLAVIECSFSYAGCSERLPRKDMPDHITESLAIHMSLQASSHQQELKKLNGRISDLEMQLDKATELQKQSTVEITKLQTWNQFLQEIVKAQDQGLKRHVGTLRGEIKKTQNETENALSVLRGDIKKSQNEMENALRGDIKKTQNKLEDIVCERVKKTEEQIAVVHEGLHNHIGLVPFSFTMPEFEHKKSSKSSWCGPSFYTHPHGYKMFLKIYANGWADGENSHIGVAVYMMKGEYDECLKWPFRGDITIQLLNQNNQPHTSTQILSIEDSAGDHILNRVTQGERSVDGYGLDQFIRHGYLCPNYLKNNSLKFRIQEVKLKI